MSLRNYSNKSLGFALIAVLWLLILLSLIAMHTSSISRTEAQLSRNLTVGAQAHQAAESGIRWAIWSLTLPEEERWLADGSLHSMEFYGSTINAALQDEHGKIDLNLVSLDHLARLFEVVEVDEEVATPLIDAILDWRDEDDLKRLNGAEDEDYQAAGLAYGAKDGVFESVEELQKVLGMEPWIYERLKPALTVYSRKSGVNPIVAPRVVLLTLNGADESTVDLYIETRRYNHENGLPHENPPFQGNLISHTLQGVYYTIHTEANAKHGVNAYRQAIISRRGVANRGRHFVIRSGNKKEPLIEGLEPEY